MSKVFGGMKRKERTEDTEHQRPKKGNIFQRRQPDEEEEEDTATDVASVLKRQKKEDNTMRTQARNALNKATKLLNLMHYNKLILDMGNTRGLYGYALQAFTDLIANKLTPNTYTFTNIINACARASEVENARKFFAMMDEYKVAKDEIAYTALMKCYCNAGRVKEAVAILEEMDTDNIEPNNRTYTTLIRECLHSNNLDLALVVLKQLTERGLKPVAAILEHFVKLYSMRLDVANAMEYLNRLQDLLHQNEENEQVQFLESLPVNVASCCGVVANACFVLGDIKTGKRMLQQGRSAMEIIHKRREANRPQWWQTKDKQKNKFRETAAAEESSSEDEDKPKRVAYTKDRVFTKNQFSNLKEKEVELELNRLDAYMKATANGQQVSVNNLTKDDKLASSQWRAAGVLKKGLTEAHRVYNIKPYPRDATEEQRAKIDEKNNGPLDWQKIFRNDQPLRVEVCSGAGEWICERARKYPSINWIAIEMSPERVFDMWCRSQLLHLKNLVIVCGEATQSLSKAFEKSSIEQIYVNYPEPPVWDRWIFRLLKEDFFTACNRSLMKAKKLKSNTEQDEFNDPTGDNGQGSLTIMTDDAGYVFTLTKELRTEGRSGHLFSSGLPSGELFTCEVPLQYGTSFYDRFWSNGSKHKRFYMKLNKIKQEKKKD